MRKSMMNVLSTSVRNSKFLSENLCTIGKFGNVHLSFIWYILFVRLRLYSLIIIILVEQLTLMYVGTAVKSLSVHECRFLTISQVIFLAFRHTAIYFLRIALIITNLNSFITRAKPLVMSSQHQE